MLFFRVTVCFPTCPLAVSTVHVMVRFFFNVITNQQHKTLYLKHNTRTVGEKKSVCYNEFLLYASYRNVCITVTFLYSVSLFSEITIFNKCMGLTFYSPVLSTCVHAVTLKYSILAATVCMCICVWCDVCFI
jgi:hypothetical protein